jgi:hypothetical protein
VVRLVGEDEAGLAGHGGWKRIMRLGTPYCSAGKTQKRNLSPLCWGDHF